MQSLLDLADAALDFGDPCVLCTVVRLDGSGYGRPGARLLLTQSGERSGYISGGCLEKDLCRRAWDATQAGAQLIAFDTRGNSVTAGRYNTGCEGVVHVLCERIDADRRGTLAVLNDVYRNSLPSKLVTVYRSQSMIHRIGDHWSLPLQISSNDAPPNLPPLLPECLHEAVQQSGRNRWVEVLDAHENEFQAAIEIVQPPQRLVVFGAGDDVIPVVRSAAALGWQVTVIGQRPELADPPRFPEARVLCGEPHALVPSLAITSQTSVIVMTHDFDRDAILLPALLRTPAQSLGLLGPKRRLARLVQRLHAEGHPLSDHDLGRLRSPVGLDIGAVTPEEIAVSIISELIAMRTDHAGGRLHDRRQPIHQTLSVRTVETPRASVA